MTAHNLSDCWEQHDWNRRCVPARPRFTKNSQAVTSGHQRFLSCESAGKLRHGSIAHS